VGRTARAFWLRAPGEGEIRTVDLPVPGPDDVVVRTLFSAVSRGTGQRGASSRMFSSMISANTLAKMPA